MVTQYTSITATDINALINSINTECGATLRNLSTLSAVSAGNTINSSTFTDMVRKNDDINAVHCYCQTGQGVVHTYTGTTLTLTAVIGDFDAGDSIDAADINKIGADISSLTAQCDCNNYSNTYTCTCDNICGCNTVCSCNVNAKCTEMVCTCNNQCVCQTNCTCVTVCRCEFGAV